MHTYAVFLHCNGNITGIRLHTWKRKSKDNATGHKGAVLALALNTDGNFMASAGQDTCINIWDFNTFAHIKTLRVRRPLALKQNHVNVILLLLLPLLSLTFGFC